MGKSVRLEGRQVKIGGAVDAVEYDMTPYYNKKVKIEKVEYLEGQFGPFCRIVSEPLETITTKENKKVEIRASKIINMKKDTEGKFIWTKTSNTGVFLSTFNVDTPDELKGRVVTVIPQEKKRGFLTFVA